jgi:hypothetical protein
MFFALALLLSTSASSDPCDRRADVVAIRAAAHAGDEALAAARAHADATARALPPGRARGCAAAVAAEAAILGGDKAATLAWLDEVATALPELVDAVRPHRALLLLELGRGDDARRAFAGIDPRSAWHERLAWRLADNDEATRILRRRASRDVEAMATLCERGDRSSCATLLVRHPGHPAGRDREADGVAGLSLQNRALRLKNLVGAARPLRAIEEGLPIARRVDVAGADRVHVDALIEHLANALWRAERTARPSTSPPVSSTPRATSSSRWRRPGPAPSPASAASPRHRRPGASSATTTRSTARPAPRPPSSPASPSSSSPPTRPASPPPRPPSTSALRCFRARAGRSRRRGIARFCA